MQKIKLHKGGVEARKVLDYCGILDAPTEISIEDIALAMGIKDVQCIPIDGSLGWINGNETSYLISYSDKIKHEASKRFVVAHELGHFQMHQELLRQGPHLDTSQSLSEWFSKGKHEKEANDFAAEMLMPSHLFKEIVVGRVFNFELIYEIAQTFKTSITATLLKYKSLGDYPVGIVFSENGMVKWTSFSEDFVLQYIPYGMNVPELSVAYDLYDSGDLPEEPEEINALTWFCEDRNVEEYSDTSFYEQCIRIGGNGVLSCIWND